MAQSNLDDLFFHSPCYRSAEPILLTQDTVLPRRSFFRGSQFALEKSRGTSRHPVAVVGDLFADPRDRAHERETGIRARNKTRRPVFFLPFSLFPFPFPLLQPLSSALPCGLLSLSLSLSFSSPPFSPMTRYRY